jgi:hypothetical protein
MARLTFMFKRTSKSIQNERARWHATSSAYVDFPLKLDCGVSTADANNASSPDFCRLISASVPLPPLLFANERDHHALDL